MKPKMKILKDFNNNSLVPLLELDLGECEILNIWEILDFDSFTQKKKKVTQEFLRSLDLQNNEYIGDPIGEWVVLLNRLAIALENGKDRVDLLIEYQNIKD